MTVQEIIDTLEKEYSTIKPSFNRGERNWNEADSESLLIQFFFIGESDSKVLDDISVSWDSWPVDIDNTIVWANNLTGTQIYNILSMLDMLEYHEDLVP